jgi:hypothetical protein
MAAILMAASSASERHHKERPLRGLTDDELEAIVTVERALSSIAGDALRGNLSTIAFLAGSEANDRNYEESQNVQRRPIFSDVIVDRLARWAIDVSCDPPVEVTRGAAISAERIAQGRQILEDAGIDWRNLKAIA